MATSFWKLNNGFTSLSNVSTILENHTVSDAKTPVLAAETLVKLLDESDLLQELMSNNTSLLEFLRDDTVINLLVDLLILESLTGDELEESLLRLNLNEKPVSGAKELPESEPGSDKEQEDPASGSLETGSDNEMPHSNLHEDPADPDDDDDDNDEHNETFDERRTRYATLAAEILSADVWSLTDTVMESTKNLNKLWSILDFSPPLSINLATYFMKIMEHLLDMKCEEMITYLIENQPNLVQKFTRHLANPPLMDFLLKLISTDKPDNSTGIIDFLQDQNLIPSLVHALESAPGLSPAELDEQLARQSSAADFLKALITISANSTTDNSTIGPNELTRELVSHDMMAKLCDIMLQGGYALGNGVGIIIEIIRKNNSDYDILPVLYITLESHPPTGRDPIYLGHLLLVFGSRIGDFNNLLMHANENNKLKTTFGEIEPLGFERFKICELIAELLHCSNMALLNDNKGFDVVRVRDDLRKKLKELDPVGFKYNEAIEIPAEVLQPSLDAEQEIVKKFEHETKRRSRDEDADYNDTIDSFNENLHENSPNFHSGGEDEEEEVHANANLTEEQMRHNHVVGDFLKIALYDTQIISNILSMFFNFPWNNFLHNVVFDIVQQVLNGSMDIGFNKFLAIDIFHSGEITVRITEGQKLCNDYEESNGGLRLGYMGHLTLIAEEVVKFIQLYPASTVSQLIDEKTENEIWEEYVSHVLYDTRKKYNAILGGSDVDEEEGSNTFDESGGDLIEDGDLDSGLRLHPNLDHDLIGSGYEDQDKEEEFTEDIDVVDEPKKSNKFTSSDDSESEEEEEEDHFASYMSLQLANSGSSGFMTSLKNKAKEFSENEGDNEPETKNFMPLKDDDGDDYIDPNDDGLSYKKPHSLYDARGMLVTDQRQSYHRNDGLLSEESSSSSDSDEEDLGDDLVDELKENKLTRSASKGS
ncbi:SAPS-domain-containing protein [Metschnikowia bicuspidata var. bicuspidata NRRL YB-4993]|uniref:SAPS-domain-containing protein n=1 Tax=Metschnikowia bicuspidata var. bicuspidata NRRL YB-4993 TaxID=869754 RepID=A0A1A0HIA5_9ASCO|nr:SAPS-domain-containing protein [Metschnikowia bicuspidata var. bicuspidata NRRL YB-4993]OBA23731.1 SAPS-domain-containing protein [Metschnikowia bicuspidata var. bicuspidata NRRL YB-4993]